MIQENIYYVLEDLHGAEVFINWQNKKLDLSVDCGKYFFAEDAINQIRKLSLSQKLRRSKQDLHLYGVLISPIYMTQPKLYVYVVYQNDKILPFQESCLMAYELGLDIAPFMFYAEDTEIVKQQSKGYSLLNCKLDRKGIVCGTMDNSVRFKYGTKAK